MCENFERGKNTFGSGNYTHPEEQFKTIILTPLHPDFLVQLKFRQPVNRIKYLLIYNYLFSFTDAFYTLHVGTVRKSKQSRS